MPAALSDSPEAVRARRYREKQRAQRQLAAAVAPVIDVEAKPANDETSSLPAHATDPLNVSGPQEFAALPFVPPMPANDNEPTTSEAAGADEPFAPPPPPPEAPPTTADEVAPIAHGVAMYFTAGAVALLSRSSADLARLGMDAGALAQHLPAAREFVRAAAERVCMKHGVKLPYQDEIVVAGALGIASFGFFGGRKGAHDEQPTTVQSEPPPAAAKQAAPTERKAPPMPASESRGKAPPMPVVEGELVL